MVSLGAPGSEGLPRWRDLLVLHADDSLPCHAWGYVVNEDVMGWRQWALVWFAGRRDQREGDPRFVHNGWNLIQIDPKPEAVRT